MTTKPRARRFRIRPTPFAEATARPAGGTDSQFAPAAPDDGFGAAVPDAPARERTGEVKSAREAALDAEIAEIRREGLTGRQLRTARRVAQRHGIAATSDFDAVRLLRRQGIDPFERANMLELVVPEPTLPAAADDPAGKPPQTRRTAPAPAPAEGAAEAARLRDIMAIQADLARRRRRRTTRLWARLGAFVLLPTALAGLYYGHIATPFYGVQAAFVINKARQASASPMAGLFAGTGFASSQDSINAQAYLQSRDALARLDRDHGFVRLFENPKIDPLQRLPPGASLEAAYRLYQRDVQVGYDPSEGIIRLQVSTPDPRKSVEFAKALIGYAQEQVDQMTQKMRDDQMAGARQSYEEAERKLAQANTRVVALQQKYKVMSGDVEVTLLTSQISALNAELNRDRLDLQQILSQPTPSPARVGPLRERIRLIEGRVAGLRARLTSNDGEGASLAQVNSQILAAEAEVKTRQVMLSQSLQALETARIAANQQTRYFSVGVSPVAPDEPTSPRAFQNTLVAFLVFAGLYLMLSMTASILREQVSG